MKLSHVGISDFRSIGEEFVMIDLTKQENRFAVGGGVVT